MNAASKVDQVVWFVEEACLLGSAARYGSLVHSPGAFGLGSRRQTTQRASRSKGSGMPAAATGRIGGRSVLSEVATLIAGTARDEIASGNLGRAPKAALVEGAA